MGCGCDKRAKKVLEVADRLEVRMPKKVRSFLERKARPVGYSPAQAVRERARRRRKDAAGGGGDNNTQGSS